MSRKKTKVPYIEEQLDFINEVEEIRVQEELNKTDLSLKAFGNPTSWHTLSHGNRNMTATTMKKLADALGMKLVICLLDKEDS